MLPPNSPYPSYPPPPAWPYKPAGYGLKLPRWDTGAAYAAIEGIGPWMKLLIWAMARRWPIQFASVQVPAIFAEQIASRFRSQGFTTRMGAGMSEQSRELAVWLEKGR